MEAAFFHLHNTRSLVLNTSYQPIRLVSWEKAFVLYYQGKVEVLEYHTSISIQTVRQSFPCPSVIRLLSFQSPKRIPRLRFSRENVYRRDQFRCQYCGEQFHSRELTLDHVVPVSQHGRKEWTNVVAACRPCNHKKGNRTPIAAGMPLLTEPRVPTWLPPMILFERRKPQESVDYSWFKWIAGAFPDEDAQPQNVGAAHQFLELNLE